MDNFALIIHPLDARRDVVRRYPLLARLLPPVLIRALARRWPPLLLSHIEGIRSRASWEGAEGWLLACPLTAGQMLRLPPQAVYDKIVQTGRLAQRQGARLLGLSAFTSLVGDGGVTIAQRLNMPVTNGNSLTVGLAVEALRRAAEERGLALDGATAAVVGGSGSVGLASAEMLAPLVEKLILVGRQEIRLSQARAEAEAAGTAEVRTSKDIGAVSEADVVLSATSAPGPILYPPHLKRGAIVCDVALPPDLAPEVRERRGDVSVIDGIAVDVPGPVDFGFDFGLPPGKAYPSMAEAMVLALERRYEPYSLGQRVYVEKVREMMQLARKHGFRLSAEIVSPDHPDG